MSFSTEMHGKKGRNCYFIIRIFICSSNSNGFVKNLKIIDKVGYTAWYLCI